VGAVENDLLAVETYRRNHPGVRVWARDIRRVTARGVARALRLRPGDLDLLAGCPPCQSFSVMRTLNRGRRVRDPKQKDLVLDFLRFVRVLRPKLVLLENVPGLAADRRFALVRQALRRLGYATQSGVLDAADFGVPQRRKRLILVGSRIGFLRLPKGVGPRRTVRDAIAGLPPPGQSGDALHDHGERRDSRVRALIRRIPKNGGSRTALGDAEQLPCHKRLRGFYDVYGRLEWEGVAPTITSGFVNPSKGRFLHPSQDRTITVREAALLQGFPRGYWFSMRRGKYGAARLIGNALPPPFVRAIAGPLARRPAPEGAGPGDRPDAG
jgi:DNA (cytosine-5)-methyltransferase 1